MFNIVDADGEPVTLGDARNVVGTEDADTLNNIVTNATILALGGDDNDSISNSGARVSICAGGGNDSFDNHGSRVTISTGAGNDTVTNSGSITLKDYPEEQVHIKSTYVAPTYPGISIDNDVSSTLVIGTAGDDTITNEGDNVTSAGNDTVENAVGNVTIETGTGDDYINNLYSSNVLIDAGNGNDSIDNSARDNSGDSVSIDAGSGDDFIFNEGDDSALNGGDKVDYIFKQMKATTLQARVMIPLTIAAPIQRLLAEPAMILSITVLEMFQ